MKLLIAVFTLCFPILLFAAPKQIRIGFIPGDNPASLKVKADQFAKLLTKEVGIPVKAYISPDYLSLAKAMKEGKVDFAFFTAATFVQAEKEIKLKVLLKKVFSAPYYYSVLLTKAESSIKKIEDLKGKKVAFVDEKSASGYLYPMVMLREKGIDSKQFFNQILFSGNHERSVELLKNGEVDGIAVFADDSENKTGAISKYLGAEAVAKYRLLWSSEPIPNDPLCVRDEFYQANTKITHDVMFALIEASERWPKEQELMKYLGVQQMTFATSKQYEPVRAMMVTFQSEKK